MLWSGSLGCFLQRLWIRVLFFKLGVILSVFSVSQQYGLLPQDFCSEKARIHCPREMIGKRKEHNSTGFSKIQWFLNFRMNQNYLVGSLKQFAPQLAFETISQTLLLMLLSWNYAFRLTISIVLLYWHLLPFATICRQTPPSLPQIRYSSCLSSRDFSLSCCWFLYFTLFL